MSDEDQFAFGVIRLLVIGIVCIGLTIAGCTVTTEHFYNSAVLKLQQRGVGALEARCAVRSEHTAVCAVVASKK